MTALEDAGSVTFTGAASLATYRQLLGSVTFTSPDAALTSILFTVTDSSGRESAPASTVVTVLGIPAAVAPVVATSLVNVSYTAGNSAVTVDSGLRLLDVDSTNMSGAVVSIVGGPVAGETLGFTAPGGIGGTYVAGTGVLTFTGTASLADYQQALRSVTFSSNSSATASIRTISFVVTDAGGNASLPGLVGVTILNVPASVPPLVVTLLSSITYTAGSTAEIVDSGIDLIDIDSPNLIGATVTITGGNLTAGETLAFTPQSGITGNYANGTLTLSGTATVAQYELALRSVTFVTDSSATSTIRSISFIVTDSTNTSSLPGTVAAVILAAPVSLAPIVTTSLAGPVYNAGNTAVTVDPLVTVLDFDSSTLNGATIQITGGLTSGDILQFTSPSGSGIGGIYTAATGSLVLTGTATLAQYQQALRSVTFASSGTAATAIRTITFTVTDSQNVTSATKSLPLAVQANAAPILTPSALAGVYSQTLAVLSLSLIPVPLIVDSSSYLQGAVIRISANAGSNDFLEVSSSAAAAASITLSGNSTGVITLSGQATVAQYQSVLNSLEFSGTLLNFNTRTIEFVTTDQQGATSNTATLQLVVTLI